MDQAQFQYYIQKLEAKEQRLSEQTASAREIAESNAARTVAVNLFKSLVAQTSICDGQNPESVRVWIREIELSSKRVPEFDVVELASRTVSGCLRHSIERFIDSKLPDLGNDRLKVTWQSLREHVVQTFLSLDEQTRQRDELEKTTQAVFETDLAFVRRFTELTQDIYPSATRTEDQSKLVVKVFLKGLLNDEYARQIVTIDQPATLNEAVAGLKKVSLAHEAYLRLGRHDQGTVNTSRKEEPMDCSGVSFSQETPAGKKLDKLLSSQEQLHSKMAKMTIRQDQLEAVASYKRSPSDRRDRSKRREPSRSPSRERRGQRRQGKASYKSKNRDSATRQRSIRTDERRCFTCNSPRHLQHDCPQEGSGQDKSRNKGQRKQSKRSPSNKNRYSKN